MWEGQERQPYSCSRAVGPRKPVLGARKARKPCALTPVSEECHYSCMAGSPKKWSKLNQEELLQRSRGAAMRSQKQPAERRGRWANRGVPEPRLPALGAPRGSEK